MNSRKGALGRLFDSSVDWNQRVRHYNAQYSGSSQITAELDSVDEQTIYGLRKFMADTSAQFELEESDFVEFKHVRDTGAHFSFEAHRAVTAFLNGRGGVIIFGVTDALQVLGLRLTRQEAEATARRCMDELGKKIELYTPALEVQSRVIEVRSPVSHGRKGKRRPKHVILFAVPMCRQSLTSRVFFTLEGIGYARLGTSTVTLSTALTMDLQPPPGHAAAASQAARLPINRPEQREALIKKIHNAQILFLSGETGCGKSSQVPKILIDSALPSSDGKKRPLRVVIAQQKRLCAIALAKRVSQELGAPIGTRVGYHIGGRKVYSSSTELLFVTTAMLRVYATSGSLRQFQVIILDEVHERDMDTDLALFYIREHITSRPDLRVILMSATLEIEAIQAYFSSHVASMTAHHIPVGSTHPVTIHYPLDNKRFVQDHAIDLTGFDVARGRLAQEVMDGMTDVIAAWHSKCRRELKPSDPIPAVLVFLPGLGNILEFGAVLRRQGDQQRIKICMLHSSVDGATQQEALQPAPRGVLKVVLATNIAESSLTVPDIGCVVDSCLAKTTVVRAGQSLLTEVWASKNALKQRAGRVGRVMPGEVYRMIPQSFEATLPQTTTPEMERVELESVVLRLLGWRHGDPGAVLRACPAPPCTDNYMAAMASLIQCRALAVLPDGSAMLTPCGMLMASLPLPLPAAQLILYGLAFQCIDEACVLAALVSRQGPIKTPLAEPRRSMDALLRFSGGTRSDIIANFNAYCWWLENRTDWTPETEPVKLEEAWLSPFHMRELDDIVIQLRSTLSLSGLCAQPRRLDNHRRNVFMNSAAMEETRVSSAPSSERPTSRALGISRRLDQLAASLAQAEIDGHDNTTMEGQVAKLLGELSVDDIADSLPEHAETMATLAPFTASTVAPDASGWMDYSGGHFTPISMFPGLEAKRRALVLMMLLGGANITNCYGVAEASKTTLGERFWKDSQVEGCPREAVLIKPVPAAIADPDQAFADLNRRLAEVNPRDFSGLTLLPAPTRDSLLVKTRRDPYPPRVVPEFDLSIQARLLAAVAREAYSDLPLHVEGSLVSSINTALKPVFETAGRHHSMSGLSLVSPVTALEPTASLKWGEGLLVSAKPFFGSRSVSLHANTLFPFDLPAPRLSVLLTFFPTTPVSTRVLYEGKFHMVQCSGRLFNRGCDLRATVDTETLDRITSIRRYISDSLGIMTAEYLSDNRDDITIDEIRDLMAKRRSAIKAAVNHTSHNLTPDRAIDKLYRVLTDIKVLNTQHVVATNAQRIKGASVALDTASIGKKTLVKKSDPSFDWRKSGDVKRRAIKKATRRSNAWKKRLQTSDD
ncbi:ATPase AAA-4 [Carpediemonas membranifera]|uniref:ATPase AAA-4 n=1 Tax=Carpediemonas membranifera TaxID=201153 RepID=A0A8J6E3Y8_9EUKA|nr:ATPase AAA-4 [Carpediemonas membranifera]|eukprot:KAG9396191.1 ATPase AAA-4 [Carpediemonas membranifera]